MYYRLAFAAYLPYMYIAFVCKIQQTLKIPFGTYNSDWYHYLQSSSWSHQAWCQDE